MYFHITKKVKQKSKIKLASRFLPYHACTVPSIAVSDTTLCSLAVRALGNKVYPQKPRFKPLLVGKKSFFFVSSQLYCVRQANSFFWMQLQYANAINDPRLIRQAVLYSNAEAKQFINHNRKLTIG